MPFEFAKDVAVSFERDNDQDNRVRPLRFICSMIHSGRTAVHPFVIQRRELNSEAQRFVKNPMQAALLGAFDSSIVCEVDY